MFRPRAQRWFEANIRLRRPTNIRREQVASVCSGHRARRCSVAKQNLFRGFATLHGGNFLLLISLAF